MLQASVGFHCPECVAGEGARPAIVRTQSSMGAPRPVVTYALLGLNGLAFLYSVVVSGSARGITRIDEGVLADGSLLASATEARDGGLVWLGVDAGEYYRLATSAFLHDGIFHLAFNMYALWLLGQLLEAGFKRSRFVALYLVSMLGGAFGALLLSAPNSPTVGASGAVFGLMGAMVLVQRAVGGDFWRSPLAMLLVINLALTLLVPRISIGGHFGGLFAGAAMGGLMLACERRNVPVWATVAMAGMVSALLVAGSVVVAAR